MQIKTPFEIIRQARNAGEAKVAISNGRPLRLIVLSMLAGAYVALGGTLASLAGYGLGPEVCASMPALQKLVAGATFPLGLILVVVLGAELFTGNNGILMPSLMDGRHGWGATLRNWTLVWLGNFAGVLAMVWLLVWLPGLFNAEPYHSAIISCAQAKVSMNWWVVFAKGIGANWCVCLALWLGMAGHTLLEKMAGCWFPVMAFVVIGYEHSIANMFYIPVGIMEGADVGLWQMFIANLLPATLGNIIGGSLFVGCVYAWLHRDAPKA